MKIRLIYLDNHATTPCDPEVVDAMFPYFSEKFGNPSSTIHEMGRDADNAVKLARSQVAKLIGAKTKEIIFTSGATESNNIAIQGVVSGHAGARTKIVTSSIEHKAILNQCQAIEEKGWEIIYLPIDETGKVSLSEAKKMITPDVLIVSVQLANNEIGTIQPIKELAEIAHENGAMFHSDAAQAVGKIPINVNQLDVDLLSISAHKMYGPKGVGALFVRGGPYSLPIKPIFYGGEQEKNLRSGTLNVPGIVGLGKASELCYANLVDEMERMAFFRDKFEKILMASVNIKRNGNLNDRLPNNSSITFPGIDAEALVVNMPELAISTGSACSSGALGPSHVLTAIGMSRDDANNTLRIGLGRFNTEEDIDKAVEIIINATKNFIKI